MIFVGYEKVNLLSLTSDIFYSNETKKIKYHRGFIEDFFKIMKVGLGFKKLNRYTLKSMHKFTALNILLAGLIVYLRIETKKDFQQFAEGTLLKCK